MAVVIRGRSVCPLCDRTLEHGEDVIAVPAALFAHPDDPHHQIWDSGVHRDCLLDSPGGTEALDAIDRYLDEE